jgi:flagellar biosynthesis/type III secretory pathway M-ring protein FliF/YscJ
MGAAMLVIPTVMGAASGCKNGEDLQNQYNSQICTLAKQQQEYSNNINTLISNTKNLDEGVNDKITNLDISISDIQQQLKESHNEFKKTYRNYYVVAIIFMIVLVFIFASKLIILHASSTGSRGPFQTLKTMDNN